MRVGEGRQKGVVVDGGVKDVLVVASPIHDMIMGVVLFYPVRPRHGAPELKLYHKASNLATCSKDKEFAAII